MRGAGHFGAKRSKFESAAVTDRSEAGPAGLRPSSDDACYDYVTAALDNKYHMYHGEGAQEAKGNCAKSGIDRGGKARDELAGTAAWK